ncbi:hypothetical protein [Sulfurospirillum oryzae]|uniref:hypothetical protein n=1 Tax=Sulfurospirillum oryzae TaxID=2976535 RepID=UPI0021E6EC0B|nr:hypothetical protein [Sulfurospirillum oryzae]
MGDTANAMMKAFLDKNEITYDLGVGKEKFLVNYYINHDLVESSIATVTFYMNNPEYVDTITIGEFDSHKYHTGFSQRYQEYKFDELHNTFTIHGESSQKHNNMPFSVVIQPVP